MEAMMSVVDFQNYFIIIFLCLFSIFFYLVFVKKPKASRLGLNLPPSPPSLPIIGHLHLLLSLQIHKTLQKLSTKYGPLLHLRVFNYPIVLVTSASVAYEIFRVHDVNVSIRDSSPLDDTVLFGSFGFVSAAYGDYWRYMKKLTVTKLLGPKAIERSRGVRADELHRCYTNLFDKATKKESVEIGQVAMKLNVDSIFRMSIGRKCSEEKDEAENIMELVTATFALTKKMLLSKLLGISLFKKEMMGVSQRFDKVLERIIVEHEENPEEHNGGDMMDVLLEAYRDENADYKITRKHIKSFFVEIFLGGSDTSTQTTQWTMAEIINNPNVLKRLREEIDSVVGKTRLIQETDLPNLPYLQAVVKEGLRLHLPGPLLPREFQQGCKIGEFYIPEKTTLLVNSYAIMRDHDNWEDPDEFKPERFLVSLQSGPKDDKRERALKYIPFGSGRRGCPGENLAYIFLGTTIGMMVQGFDWRVDKEEKVNMEEAFLGMNLTMAHPTKFTPISRTLNPLQSWKL